MTKRAEALKPPASIRKRKFTISAITAAIHEKNTGTKVEPSRITQPNVNHSCRPSPQCNPPIETLVLIPTGIRPVVSQALTQSGTSLSKYILANPSSNPKSYVALLCNELHQGQVDIGKNVIPTRYDVLRNSPFGKLDLAHSFTSEACFEHSLLHLLETSILSQSDTISLLSCHPLFLHLHKMIQWATRIDFSLLGHNIVNYSTQQQISTTRVQQLLAAALFYDLDLSTVIRFLRGTDTGEFRQSSSTLVAFHQSNCNPALIKEVKRTLLVGCPNNMTASSTHDNFLKFFRYGNHSSITHNLPQVLKTLNKEDRNQYLLPFPNWLARFMKQIHVTPQGILSKSGKNDRLIWDGSFIYQSGTPRNQKLCMVTPFNATSIELGIPASLFPTRSYTFLTMTLNAPFGIPNTIPTSQENFPSSSPSTLWLPLDKHSVPPIAPKIGNPSLALKLI